jgi:hypothetical protein
MLINKALCNHTLCQFLPPAFAATNSTSSAGSVLRVAAICQFLPPAFAATNSTSSAGSVLRVAAISSAVPQSFSAIFHYNDNNKEALNSVTK